MRPFLALIAVIALAALAALTTGCTCKPAAAPIADPAAAAPAAAPAPAATDGDDPAAVARTSLAATGDAAPAFTAPLLGGGAFDLEAQRGKVVLVNFFATWCPPCQAEMPHLQAQVWTRFGARGDFAMVSVAREEGADVVGPFVQKYGASWPFALDKDRSVFARYAEAYIPRSYVLDRTGRIIFQSQGYEETEFAGMVAAIAAELEKPAP